MSAIGGGSSRATAERMRWPLSTCDGRTSRALARRGEARVRGRGGARRACSSTPSVTCAGAPRKARRGGKPAQRERARGRGLGWGEHLRGACSLLRRRADERKHGGRAGRGFDRGAGREEFPPTDPRSGMWQRGAHGRPWRARRGWTWGILRPGRCSPCVGSARTCASPSLTK